MRIAVIIASLGRGPIVGKLMERLAAQTRPPDKTIVSVVNENDGPAAIPSGLDVDVILAPLGSCAQRNRGLDHIGGTADVVVFLDDDFVPASDYLENLDELFAARAALVGATGHVVADGVTGPGIAYEEALRIITAHPDGSGEVPMPCLYGCNMAFRASAIGDVRFDERLPLYGWLEDVDFSVRVANGGEMIESRRLVGVHLGVKAGRTSGVRFGYSQIINPVYLNRKGTVPLRQAASNLVRNFVANHIRAFAPESYIDRRGRVKGNWLAIFDLIRGKAAPERILDL